MKNKNDSIKCDVKSCSYNNCNFCTLDKIKISCTCNNDECSCNEQTICESFKEEKE